ncbi:MAG TPA: hypothetical protein GX707_14685 [Epulopiscium sp.]|nr:hypothetical protein [Candidatus Epulonipiscium sp.]
MKKSFSILLVFVLSLSILTGCSKPATADQSLSTQPPSKIASEFTDADGVFNGIIDTDSVEIAMSPQDIVVFTTYNVADQITPIKPGDKVKFSYVPGPDDRLTISKIEVME